MGAALVQVSSFKFILLFHQIAAQGLNDKIKSHCTIIYFKKIHQNMFIHSKIRGVANGGGRGADCPPPRTPKIGKESKNREGGKGGKERKKRERKRKEKREGRREREREKEREKEKGKKKEKGKERKREEKGKREERGRGKGGRKGREKKENAERGMFHRYLNIYNGMNFA